MAAPRIAYRMPRSGRGNPGRRHIAGRDVTAKMQRQYEHVLQSLRSRHRYGSSAKRKQVAAATVRALNPSWFGLDDESRAEQLAEEFHGRPAREFIDVEEEEAYDDYGAVLGHLQRLKILMEDGESYIPIAFDYKYGSPDNVLVVSDPEGKNIEFVGGDQNIDWQRVDGASEADKNLVLVGPVLELEYFADKHHLSGPAEQKKGITYWHKFGPEDDEEEDEDYIPEDIELPYLVFDRRNRRLLFVGGSYTIEPEGITG